MKKYPHGQFSWADLGSPSVDASKKFYTSLFGWDVREMPMPEGGDAYTLCLQRGQQIAGIGGQPPAMKGAPAVWTSYINVDNVDAIAARVTQHGGKVLMPAMDVMSEGRMLIVQDPTGATVGCWQPKNHTGAGLLNEVGALSWFELMTNDVAAAKQFYTGVFGWAFKESKDYSEFSLKPGSESFGGMMTTPKEASGMPNMWMPYFNVAQVEAICTKAKQLGGKVLMGAHVIPNVGTFAVLSDPQGGAFNVIAMNAK